MTRRFNILAAATALMFFGLGPAPAHATTSFGADLSRPANVDFDCTVIPGETRAQSNYQSCSWANDTSGPGTDNETFMSPVGSGVITRIRVKVGPTTGPMQVVILEGSYQDGFRSDREVSCCKEINRTGAFTPKPNAVTALDVSLPVRNDTARGKGSGDRAFDLMALSVLQAGVPVPAHDTGVHDGTGSNATAWWPAWQPGQERADRGGPSGYVVLLNADWEPR